MEFLACSTDTARFNLAIVMLAPHASGPEPHRHNGEDDAFYVLEGVLTVREGQDQAFRAGPGTFVLVPPGVTHTFGNDAPISVRMLNIHAPAGFDRLLMEEP